MTKILLTGASSYVGARIYEDLKNKYGLVGTYFQHQLFPELVQLDLTDKRAVEQIISQQKPKIIIHVANYPSVKEAANNEPGYIKLNKEATETLVGMANKIGAKIIFISSFAALNTSDIYGKLKLESEEIVKKTQAGYLILRLRLVIGLSPNTVNDRSFNRILRCVINQQSGEFDNSWVFRPTYLPHLSQVIDQVIKHNNFWNKTISIVIDHETTLKQIAQDILKEFELEAKAAERGHDFPVIKEDASAIAEFGLKPATYKEMIKEIVREVKQMITYR